MRSQNACLSSKKMLYTGLGAILFVPIFKAVTGLPPYVGMLFSLGVVWLVSEYVKPVKNLSRNEKNLYSTHKALSNIEFSSILVLSRDPFGCCRS